jgi:hypothetical protein
MEYHMKSRIAAALLTFMLLGGWFDDPPSWAKPDGGPIDPDVFQHERSVCATQAAVYSGREDLWMANFTECMKHYGYVPIRRDILPGTAPTN